MGICSRGAALFGLVIWTLVSVAGQAPRLTIVSATPSGELARLGDGGEVRLVFSEPMVALGDAAANTRPSWLTMTPAVPGTFYWSGTTTLIFSPDPRTPLPYGTRFTIRVDPSATSVAGRTLAAPYDLTFTTPTVRFVKLDAYRKNGRFDDPVILVMRFNQPMRAEDVVRHTTVAHTPYYWEPPILRPADRRELTRTEPEMVARFDAKVSRVRKVIASSERVGIGPALAWNTRQHPPAPEQVVLETATVPPPDAMLTVTIGAALPGLQGQEPHPAQSQMVQLPPTFFIRDLRCASDCHPSFSTLIQFSSPVEARAAGRALTVVDVTTSPERPVTRREDDSAGTHPSGGETVAGLGFGMQPPNSTWRLRIDPTLRSIDGQTLDYAWQARVRTQHAPAFTNIEGGVWESGAGPALPMKMRNVTSMVQQVGVVGDDEIIPRLRELSDRGAFGGEVTRTLQRFTPVADAITDHPVDIRQWLSSRGTGIVSLLLTPRTVVRRTPPLTDDARSRSLIQVTNLGITVKQSPTSVLVFVTHLDSGAVVPNARVTIVDGQRQPLWRGETDGSGIARAAVTIGEQPDDFWRTSFLVVAEKDGDRAFVPSTWTDFPPPSGAFDWRQEGNRAGMVFADRGVYRVGEDVHFKAIVREAAETGLRPLPGQELRVVIHGPNGDRLDPRVLALSDWSSAEWTWRIPESAGLGSYDVSLYVGATEREERVFALGEFLVAAYRTPTFKVETTFTAEAPILGSPLRGTVDARYLFGAPMGSARVGWRATRVPIHAPPPAVLARYPHERYAVGYLSDDGTHSELPVADSAQTLDGTGHLALDVRTAPDSDQQAYRYQLEATVQDVAQQEIAGRSTLVMHPASLYVAVSRPPTFVDTRNGATVTVAAVGLDGQPVAGVPVSVSLLREDWTAGAPDETGRVEFARQLTPAGEWTVRSAIAGAALAVPVTRGGAYVLRAIAADAKGQRARTELTFYAVGDGLASWRGDGHRIELTPERPTWKAGERARILVQSPWPRATGLLTIEREHVRTHETFTVTSTQDTLEVPITEADLPNVFVSVLLVKGRTSIEPDAHGQDPGAPSYRIGTTELKVDPAVHQLQVRVTTDKPEYRPAAPATVTVRVTSSSGDPVPAETTLWAVDEAVLSLTAYETPDPMRAIYLPREHRVRTGDSRQFIMRRHGSPRPDLSGGRGVLGGVAMSLSVAGEPMPPHPIPEMQEQVDVREDFRSLAFWLGSLTTGADGTATTTVTLPDSLTSYRLIAVAADRQSRFGAGNHEIRVSKALTLVPAFPRFMNAGDRASIGAVVTNNGPRPRTVTVTLESRALESLHVDGVSTRRVDLAPGASAPVQFGVIALAVGRARVQMRASIDTDAGGERDAFESAFDVTTPSRLFTSAAYGETTGRATEAMALPKAIDDASGGLHVDLASTALVGLGESARYLDEYPHPCAEQRASRALALILASELGSAFALATVKPAEYRLAAERSLQELYRYQCGDGRIALWPGSCSVESAYLTAYVLHVVKAAERRGIAPDRGRVDMALQYVERSLTQEAPSPQWFPVWAASRAYSLKVLAEFGRDVRKYVDALVPMVERVPLAALSDLADVLAASNDRGARYRDLLRRLTNATRIDADRAHVEQADESILAWLWDSNVRATAVVMSGFSRRQDAPRLVAPMVRWLLAARRGGRWGTTHENATVLEALVAYYRAFEAEPPNMTASVSIGSRVIGTATFTGRSTDATRVGLSIRELEEMARAQTTSTLTLAREGTGRLYYTARLRYPVSIAPDAVDRGYQVTRSYEPFVQDGRSAPQTTFAAGDLVRVRLTVTTRGEARYLALTDPLPAGFEPVESWFQTTARNLVVEAVKLSRAGPAGSWLPDAGFDHVERHDNRVVAYATRLASGRHEFAYLARATTAGTFTAAGAQVEAMYAPELEGRSAAATVTVTSRAK